MMLNPDEGPSGKVVFTLVAHIPLEACHSFWFYPCSGSLIFKHQSVYKPGHRPWTDTHKVIVKMRVVNALEVIIISADIPRVSP